MLIHHPNDGRGARTDWALEILISPLAGAAWALFWSYVLHALGYTMPATYYALIVFDGAASYLAGVGLRSRVKAVGEEERWRWGVGLRHTRYKRAWKVPRLNLWLLY